jgi:hypothetical protein
LLSRDNPDTVKSIAKSLNVENADKSIIGEEPEGLSETDFIPELFLIKPLDFKN